VAPPSEHGTSELLEVAFRFGRAVTGLAAGSGTGPERLLAAWQELDPVDGALSGLWPEPMVPIDLADLARDLLVDLTAEGSIERTVAAMDADQVARAATRITALAFALHQAVGAATA
jgi:hypothetical protein